MSGPLLVAIAGTTDATLTLPAIVHLAHALDAGLTLCHQDNATAKATLRALTQAIGTAVHCCALDTVDSAGRLLAIAGHLDPAMICLLPGRRHPLLAWLRSRTSRRVVAQATCPVLLFRAGAHRVPPFQHLMVAWDGSSAADRAVECGLHLAQALKARLTLLSISPVVPAALPADALVEAREAAELATGQAQARLQDWQQTAVRAGLACTFELIPGNCPWRLIGQRFGKLEADLLLLGRHLRTRLERMLEGSNLDALLQQEEIDVLVVP